MKSLEQFKKEITEEEKQKFLAYAEEQIAAGRSPAEIAEYIRAKGYDVTADDISPVDDDNLEGVTGGMKRSKDRCFHSWEKTGREKEDSYFIFWTKRYVEFKCTRCALKQGKWQIDTASRSGKDVRAIAETNSPHLRYNDGGEEIFLFYGSTASVYD